MKSIKWIPEYGKTLSNVPTFINVRRRIYFNGLNCKSIRMKSDENVQSFSMMSKNSMKQLSLRRDSSFADYEINSLNSEALVENHVESTNDGPLEEVNLGETEKEIISLLHQLGTFYPNSNHKKCIQSKYQLSLDALNRILHKIRRIKNMDKRVKLTMDHQLLLHEAIKNNGKISYAKMQKITGLSKMQLYELVRRIKYRSKYVAPSKNVIDKIEQVVYKYEKNSPEMYAEIREVTKLSTAYSNHIVNMIRRRQNSRRFSNENRRTVEELYQSMLELPISHVIEEIMKHVPQNREQVRKFINRKLKRKRLPDLVKQEVIEQLKHNSNIEFEDVFSNFISKNFVRISPEDTISWNSTDSVEVDFTKNAQFRGELYTIYQSVRRKIERSQVSHEIKQLIQKEVMNVIYPNLSRKEKSEFIEKLRRKSNISTASIHYYIRLAVAKQNRDIVKEYIEINHQLPREVLEHRLRQVVSIPHNQIQQLVHFYIEESQAKSKQKQGKSNLSQLNSFNKDTEDSSTKAKIISDSVNQGMESVLEEALKLYPRTSELYDYLESKLGLSRIQLYSIVRKYRSSRKFLKSD